MRRIVVDIYGGDLGPEVMIEGAFDILSERDDVCLIFSGDKTLVDKIAENRNIDRSKYEVLNTTKFISNNDNPKLIYKGYNDTSLVKALVECQREDVDALISAGSTGAVLLGSMFRLGLFPGIKFPCLSATIKDYRGNYFCLLDCGAIVDATANNMRMFASFGSAYMKYAYGIESPRIGLLNVGAEKSKGNKLAKETYPLLQTLGLNFIGNVEGNDVFAGKADVVVADGFSGNVLLKAAECIGLASKAAVDMKIEEAKTKEAKTLLGDVSDFLYSNYAYNELGCSVLLGTKKIVCKCHGKAERKTVLNSIKEALRLADGGFIDAVSKECEEHIKTSEDHDHRKAIKGFGTAAAWCFNGGIIGMGATLLNIAFILSMWIVGSKYSWDSKAMLALNSALTSLIGISLFFVAAFITGIVFRAVVKRKKMDDPRFADSIDNYSVY